MVQNVSNKVGLGLTWAQSKLARGHLGLSLILIGPIPNRPMYVRRAFQRSLAVVDKKIEKKENQKTRKNERSSASEKPKRERRRNGEVFRKCLQRRPWSSTRRPRSLRQHLDWIRRLLRSHLVQSLHVATLQSIQVLFSDLSLFVCSQFRVLFSGKRLNSIIIVLLSNSLSCFVALLLCTDVQFLLE